jgi:subtilisin family serine protease
MINKKGFLFIYKRKILIFGGLILIITALIVIFIYNSRQSNVEADSILNTENNLLSSQDQRYYLHKNALNRNNQEFIIVLGPSLADTIKQAALSMPPAAISNNTSSSAKSPTLAQSVNIKLAQDSAKSTISKIIPGVKISTVFSGELVNGVVAELTNDQYFKLISLKYKVYPNNIVMAELDQSVPRIRADKVWSLKDMFVNNVNGTGVKIGIIDSGIDYTHPDLGSCTNDSFLAHQCAKVVGGYNFVNNSANPIDDFGHGTHVASIASGDGFLKGVAPKAALYAYKVLDNWGSGSTSNIIKGMEYSVDPNQDGNIDDHLDIANLSIGSDYQASPDDIMAIAANNAVDLGISVIVSAGNSGPGPGTISSPATASKAISVAASDKFTGLASFSSRGPISWTRVTGQYSSVKPDISAPGVDICAAAAHDNQFSPSYSCKDSRHLSLSGTSMAAPHIAGVAALIKQMHPNWTPAQIKSEIVVSADKPFVGFTNNKLLMYGNGITNSLKAVQSTSPPAVVSIDPIKHGAIDRAVTISGNISGNKISKYSINIVPKNNLLTNAQIWTSISGSPNQFSFSQNIDLNRYVDGDYLVRVFASDASGISAASNGYLSIHKYSFTNLLPDDIYRSGDKINVVTKYFNESKPINSTENYSFGVGRNPSSWRPINIATFDTTGLETGYYSIRSELNHDGIKDVITTPIYLDSNLQPGWPVRVPYGCAEAGPYDALALESQCYSTAGMLETTVDDVNNDGKNEVVSFSAGKTPKLTLYNLDGSKAWETQVGSVGFQNYYFPSVQPPVIGKDKFGNKKIFVFVDGGTKYRDQNYLDYSQIYSYDGGGKLVDGWPVRIDKSPDVAYSAGDLNGDGEDELILISWKDSTIGYFEELAVFDLSGNKISSWDLPEETLRGSWWSDFTTKPLPSVADINNDGKNEIIIARTIAQDDNIYDSQGWLAAYDGGGKILNGWPLKLPLHTGIFNSPAIGDVLGNGTRSIVFQTFCTNFSSCSGVYIYSPEGVLQKSWSRSATDGGASSVALGDVDKDGILDIFACYLDISEKPLDAKSNCDLYNPRNEQVAQITENHDAKAGGTYRGSAIIGGEINSQSGLLLWATYGGVGMFGYPKFFNSNNIISVVNTDLTYSISLKVEFGAYATVNIGDFQKNGNLGVISSSAYDSYLDTNGTEMMKKRGSIYYWLTSGTPSSLSWPTFHANNQRNGLK